jgi:hypothetical protein
VPAPGALDGVDFLQTNISNLAIYFYLDIFDNFSKKNICLPVSTPGTGGTCPVAQAWIVLARSLQQFCARALRCNNFETILC